MKLKMGEYEVTISVKGRYSKRSNKKDTINFLNYMSILLKEGSRALEKTEPDMYKYVIRDGKKMGDDIYHFLKDMGVYDNL